LLLEPPPFPQNNSVVVYDPEVGFVECVAGLAENIYQEVCINDRFCTNMVLSLAVSFDAFAIEIRKDAVGVA